MYSGAMIFTPMFSTPTCQRPHARISLFHRMLNSLLSYRPPSPVVKVKTSVGGPSNLEFNTATRALISVNAQRS